MMQNKLYICQNWFENIPKSVPKSQRGQKFNSEILNAIVKAKSTLIDKKYRLQNPQRGQKF